MLEREYYHLENMNNFEQLPSHGFKLNFSAYCPTRYGHPAKIRR
jgi:hypothetical protein